MAVVAGSGEVIGFGDPAPAPRDPGELVAGEDRGGVIVAEDAQAQDQDLVPARRAGQNPSVEITDSPGDLR
jgi:hypothetical protein